MEAEIRNLLEEGGVSFKQNNKSFIMTCPRCNKKDKLYIRRSDGKFVCWYCAEIDNFYGRAEFALTELVGMPVEEVRKKIYGEEGHGTATVDLHLNIKDYGEDEDFVDLAPSPQIYAWPLEFYTLDKEEAKKGVDYLERRGIHKALAIEYGIRYDPAKCRVIFPVQSHGELYGWQARLIEGDKPYWDERQRKIVTPLKIVTSPDLKRDRCMMFIDRLEGRHHAVLTEGPVDAIKAHLCGGNVASMGKAVSNGQLEILHNAGIERLYLGLDPDAWLEIDRIRKKMWDMVVFDLRPPKPYKDLGEMPLEAVQHLFDHAPVLNSAQIVLYLKTSFGAE